jgi:lipopolysaccharide heptosyltransferase II
METFWTRTNRKLAFISKMEKKKILVLNLVPNTIGDSIILLSMFNIIKKNHPTSYLAVTADNISKNLWSDNQEIDEIIEIKELEEIGNRSLSKLKKSLLYLKMLFALSSKLKKEKFDMCFITYPNFFLMPLIPWLAKIKERIGFTYKGAMLSFLLTRTTPSKIVFDGYFERHIVESFLDLLRVANLKFSHKDVVSRKNVKATAIANIKKKLLANEIDIDNNKILTFHTMSKSELRNWPKDRFKELLSQIMKNNKTLVFLVGSEKEFGYNEDIRTVNSRRIFNMCGKLSLEEIGALLKISNLFIGNDSGIAHYASSVGTGTIVLFGTSNPIQAKPIGYGKVITIFNNRSENTCNYLRYNDKEADLESMKTIKVKDVLEKAEQFLK